MTALFPVVVDRRAGVNTLQVLPAVARMSRLPIGRRVVRWWNELRNRRVR
jgi:hypothetical protein